ncbi:MAG TPA: hypothetical protein VGH48_17490 [Caldimonas sp.]
MLVASTETTVRAAPAPSTATGAAADTAIGSADSALTSDRVDCARLSVVAKASDAAIATAT